MTTDTVTLEEALRLLSLPRLVGSDPESGDEITAQNGRYGPYLKKGTDSRSLTSEEQLFTVTLDEALEIYKQPKQRGRRTAAATPPLRELGEDSATKKPMVIKDGRFGPYVTDGETNASLRKGDTSRRSPTSGRPSCWPSAARRHRHRRRPRRAGRRRGRRLRRSSRPGANGTFAESDAVKVPFAPPGSRAGQPSSWAFTAAATRPPSARLAAAAVAFFMTCPICRGPGCSPSSAAVSATAWRAISASSSSVSWVGR